MKFGGTSVKDVAAFARAAEIVGAQKDSSPVVITSAMSKVTDALLAAFDTAKKGDSDSAAALLEPHLERHVEVCENLCTQDQQKSFLTELVYARRN
jgi:aspartokinase